VVHAAYVSLWKWIFLLALALELPMVFFLAQHRRGRAVLASLLGNAVTHPALWFVWPRLLPYSAAVIVGELFAVGVEGAAIATLGGQKRRGFLIALAVNAYSYALGELVMRAIGPALWRFWMGR
jgi:hypothetical protein